jgi:hypothetical protein
MLEYTELYQGRFEPLETEAWIDEDTGKSWWLLQSRDGNLTQWLRNQDKSVCTRSGLSTYWVLEEFIPMLILQCP